MPSHETIDVRIEGAAATIELNRPDQLNAWNLQLGTDLHEAVKSLGADDAVRAVMITGAGRAFSSGADLKEERSADEGLPDLGERLKSLYNPIILEIREMEKPVVAGVNGPAVGVGCALALACDLLIAADPGLILEVIFGDGLSVIPFRFKSGWLKNSYHLLVCHLPFVWPLSYSDKHLPAQDRPYLVCPSG